MEKTLVLKFGGASLKDVAQFDNVAAIIEKETKSYDRICVVVSAMEGVTDFLENLASKVHDNPPKREKDMLLSVGERISMALLAMTLQKRGIEAVSFTGSQAGIITTAEHSNARIIDVKPFRLEAVFKEGKIPIIAGFQGVSIDKEITTLGRGGSDTTAAALAIALGADRAVFYKDVEGVCSKDPKKHPDAEVVEHLSYEEALEVIGQGKAAVLHPRCVQLAMKNELILQVRSFDRKLKDKKGSIVFSVQADRLGTTKIYEEAVETKI